jgi:putative transcriptional regulator
MEQGLILHEPTTEWDSTLKVSADLALTTSRDILVAMAENRGPHRSLLALGYAGWSGGQLEHEMKQNAWLSGPVDQDIIFDVPVELRWTRAAASMGVDLSLLSSQAGHA